TFALLNEKEINNITVDEIAEKAIVSKVTIFKYYKNKNHLMNIVIMRAFEHMAKEIEEVIKSNLNFEETYEAITRMKISQLEKYSSIFLENLMTQYTHDPEFSTMMQSTLKWKFTMNFLKKDKVRVRLIQI